MVGGPCGDNKSLAQKRKPILQVIVTTEKVEMKVVCYPASGSPGGYG